jgi:hypothetical protein
MNVLDRRLVEDVAGHLRSNLGLVEKDWHVTRAIGVLTSHDHDAAVPAFDGGTSSFRKSSKASSNHEGGSGRCSGCQ